MTHLVRLTPPGRGAIASLLLDGPGAISMLAPFLEIDPFFLYGAEKEPIFTRLRLENQAEEIVLHAVSPTCLRLHCHGGEAVIAAVTEAMQLCGATVIDPFDWLKRQAMPIEAEARALLARCRTERTARIMLDQVGGAFRHLLEELRISELLRWSALGLHLVEPFRIALVGLPNAGKSSLLNALLGFQRSLVDDTPGTTRDFVVIETAFDGWPMMLIDTAGLRETTDPIEQAGVLQTTSILRSVDLTLEVIDATTGCRAEMLSPPSIPVLNKIDLVDATMDVEDAVRVSAVTGEGMETLMHRIVQSLVPESPPPGQGMPFTAEQVALLMSLRYLPNDLSSMA